MLQTKLAGRVKVDTDFPTQRIAIRGWRYSTQSKNANRFNNALGIIPGAASRG
jgi:hypothetical protein